VNIRPRVLHIITSLAVGGAQRHLLALISGLSRSFDIDVLYFRDHDLRQLVERVADGVSYLPMAGRAGTLHLPRLTALIRRGNYSIVHTHLLRADVYGALAARAAGVSAVVSSKHNIEARLASMPSRALYRLMTRSTRRTIAISDAVANWAVHKLGVVAEDVRVVRYGIDPMQFNRISQAEARRALGVDGDVPLILCPARLDPQKRHDVLLRAFALVLEDFPRAVLLCAGDTQLGGASYRGKLRRTSVELGVDHAVRWLGVRHDIPELMAASDLVALASDWEGLGLVLMESAVARRPVVATAVGGVPEVVISETTGVLVPQGDHLRMGQEIRTMLSGAERRTRMGTAAGEHARANFDLGVMHDATEDVYRQLLHDTTV
jgi:glycosyltransferase involved in cell wall biosynthesis